MLHWWLIPMTVFLASLFLAPVVDRNDSSGMFNGIAGFFIILIGAAISIGLLIGHWL